ncbi:MAG: adenylate/guanylate cyclase domain-containing protein [Nitrospirae bacterium]|nr:adenylate/guanylate cyclase domain-containing protein [Nitrospirota bacterium]
MEININEKLLDEKLTGLEKARAWSPRTISKLETTIRSAEDLDLFRINPKRYASERGTAESEAIDLFLHLAHLGLFQMDWHMTCPACGDVLQSLRSLSHVSSEFSCGPCKMNFEANLDDYISVTFTIAPQIRRIRYHDPESLSPEDYVYGYKYSQDARFSGGPRVVDGYKPMVRFGERFQPGERKSMGMTLTPGVLAVRNFESESYSAFLEVAESGETRVLLEFMEGSWRTKPPRLGAGSVTAEVVNLSRRPQILGGLNLPPGDPSVRPLLEFEPFLSGKELLTTQTFRDLFRSEVIKGTEGISVKDITFLFTDLKGSTALYDRIGDLKAYALVRQHFDSLGKVIVGNSGAIVKTIGDAVMASFLTPKDGVNAALGMIKEIDAFNQTLPSKDIILKVGVHKGPSIAVTLNERLDYFGQTVNIAARVQGLAEAEEIYVTDDVYRSSQVKGLLDGRAVTPLKATLKGVRDEMQVYKIAPPAVAH